MHGSNLAAERYEATQRLKWASALFRCCMHRIQAAEKVLLQGLERRAGSFFSARAIVIAEDAWQSDDLHSWLVDLRLFLG